MNLSRVGKVHTLQKDEERTKEEAGWGVAVWLGGGGGGDNNSEVIGCIMRDGEVLSV